MTTRQDSIALEMIKAKYKQAQHKDNAESEKQAQHKGNNEGGVVPKQPAWKAKYKPLGEKAAEQSAVDENIPKRYEPKILRKKLRGDEDCHMDLDMIKERYRQDEQLLTPEDGSGANTPTWKTRGKYQPLGSNCLTPASRPATPQPSTPSSRAPTPRHVKTKTATMTGDFGVQDAEKIMNNSRLNQFY
eukprot:Selendium_serpulae@DN3402_c0_g1_i2.p1